MVRMTVYARQYSVIPGFYPPVHCSNLLASHAVAVLMEASLGGIVLKSAMRLIGTLLAGLLGVG